MMVAWWVQRRTGASGWVDAIWSFAVGLGGLAAVLLADGDFTLRKAALIVLVGFWSLRLGGHIATRTAKGGDDPRYKQLSEEWGEAFPRRLFLFLQIQAVAGLALAVSVQAAASNMAEFPGVLDMIAVLVAIIAVVGEGIADRQLARFKAQPHAKGAICEKGLWGWSRHPNYFFEWLFWCALPFLAASLADARLSSLLSLLAPLMMYWLLVHVSGIPPLEAHMQRSRGAAFRDLQQRVNAFFPGPPKRGAGHSSSQSARETRP
ncbi:DUF1295 domain-containing protein [Rhizobium halophytocola]|nr:DUF1295 domain-containing protein [Rhizobium halophytocola]